MLIKCYQIILIIIGKLHLFSAIHLFFNVILSSKGSLNFSPPEGNIDLHILCMPILGCWVPDRLPSRRLFELVAATQCTF